RPGDDPGRGGHREHRRLRDLLPRVVRGAGGRTGVGPLLLLGRPRHHRRGLPGQRAVRTDPGCRRRRHRAHRRRPPHPVDLGRQRAQPALGARALRAHGRRGRAERARLSAAARRTPVRRSTPLVLAGGLLVLALACMLSLMVGARTVPPSTVVEALSDYDASLTDHVVVHSRLLRTLAGIAVGAALAVAGAAMQGMTRNPLADPGILGINAGATAAVVLGGHLVDASRVVELMALALLGAAAGTVAVYAVASLGRDGATPVKLALAGAALTAGLGSVVNALVMVDDSSLQRLRFWQVGTLGARSLEDISRVAGLMALGAVVILLTTGMLNALALGDDVAAGLGVRVGRARVLLGTAIILLCGAAVALAGPIGFLGLVVPHAARLLVGGDYRRIVPLCLLGGPVLILLADTVGRVIAPPAEVQVGVMTALIGVPVFIVLLRSRRQVGL